MVLSTVPQNMVRVPPVGVAEATGIVTAAVSQALFWRKKGILYCIMCLYYILTSSVPAVPAASGTWNLIVGVAADVDSCHSTLQ